MSRESNIHYITPSSISITPNANGSENDIAVYVARNAQIKVLAPGVGISSGWFSFQQWTLTGRNRRLADKTLPYTIYARLSKNDHENGYIVFAPKNKIGDKWADKYAYVSYNNIIQPALSVKSKDYWYIRLGDVSLPEDGKRTVTLDTGVLGTDKYNNEWIEELTKLPLRVELGCTINDEDAGQTPYVRWGENVMLTALLMKGWNGVDSERFHHWEITRNTGYADTDVKWPSTQRQDEFKKTGAFTLRHSRGDDDDFDGAMSAVFTITAWGMPETVDDDTEPTGEYVVISSKSITILAEAVEKYELSLSSSVVSYSPQTDEYNPKQGIKVRIRAIDQRGDVIEISNAQLKREHLSVGFAPTDSNVWVPLTFNGSDTDIAEATIGTASFRGQKSLNVQLTRPVGTLSADNAQAVAELARTTIAFVRDGEDSREREWVFIRSKAPIVFGDDVTNAHPLPALISGGEVKPKGAANGKDSNKNQDGWVPQGWWDEQHGVDSEWCYEYGAFRDYQRNDTSSSEGSSNPGHWGEFSTPRIWNHYGTDGGKPVSRYQWSKNAEKAPRYTSNQQNPGNEWKIDIPTRPEGQGWYLWTISAIKNSDGTYGPWGDPIRMTGDEGVPGTKTQRVYYKSDSDKAPDAPEGDVTSSLDTPRAWRTVALTADEYNRYVYICERISEDNGKSWKPWGNVVLFCYRPNRRQIEDLIRVVGDERYLRKDTPDTAHALITFLKGVNVKGVAELETVISDTLQSPDFKQGLHDGTGFRLFTDEYGKSVAEVDKLLVRLKMIIQELEIRKLSYVGGDQVFSSAGSKISSVKVLPNGDYRCYILADDGTTRTENDWRIGDQVKCKTDNIKAGVYENVANRYYWRLVVARGEETLTDGKVYHYIDLSNTRGSLDVIGEDGKTHTCVGYDTTVENDAPQADDSIVQLGNQIDTDRQYAYIIYVSEKKRVDYAGINDYDLASHEVEKHSASGGFIHSDRFEIVSSSGTGVSSPIVCDRGTWTTGMKCGHYDRVSHNGSLWLCNVGKGKTTTEEPSENSKVWIKQVEKGEQGESPLMLGLYVSRGGLFYHEGQEFIADITVELTRGGSDITKKYHPSQIVWSRESVNPEGDTAWALAHRNIGSTLTLSANDMVALTTTFVCTVYDEHGNEQGSESIAVN